MRGAAMSIARLLMLIASLAYMASAFVPSASMSATIRRVNMQQQTAHRSPTVALAPGSKVGKAKVQLQKSLSLAQPKEEAQKAATDGAKAKPKQRRVTESEDCPMYKVLLLGDEGYEREHVIMAIQDIIPETDNKKSTEIFEEAQKTGTGMCGVFPEEHAELYVQQFTRCEPMIYADMEEE